MWEELAGRTAVPGLQRLATGEEVAVLGAQVRTRGFDLFDVEPRLAIGIQGPIGGPTHREESIVLDVLEDVEERSRVASVFPANDLLVDLHLIFSVYELVVGFVLIVVLAHGSQFRGNPTPCRSVDDGASVVGQA
jgi:hypothetical protein